MILFTSSAARGLNTHTCPFSLKGTSMIPGLII